MLTPILKLTPALHSVIMRYLNSAIEPSSTVLIQMLISLLVLPGVVARNLKLYAYVGLTHYLLHDMGVNKICKR